MSFLRKASRPLAWVAIFLVRVYQVTLSPLKYMILGAGAGCRFRPTCSHYAIECFRTLPFYRAFYLSGYRILKCNPWGGSGYDPVPKCGCGNEESVEPSPQSRDKLLDANGRE